MTMRRRIDSDDGIAGFTQRCDEAAETCRMRTPAVKQHHPRTAVAPAPDGECVRTALQGFTLGLRDDRDVARLDLAAWRREEHTEGEAAREWHADPLQHRKHLAQAPLQGGRHSRNHASE